MPDEGLISVVRRLRDDSQRKAQPTPLGRLVAFRGAFESFTFEDETAVEVRSGQPYYAGPQSYSSAHGRATSVSEGKSVMSFERASAGAGKNEMDLIE